MKNIKKLEDTKNGILFLLTLTIVVLVAIVFWNAAAKDKSYSYKNYGEHHTAMENMNRSPVNGAGVSRVESDADFASTTAAIRTAIESNENLMLVNEIDHAANAENAGLDLPPTTLFIFGNPNAGTPLMQESRSVAIDLPQKMLVTEESGDVVVRFNAPEHIASRHDISGQQMRLENILNVLQTIANAANDDV